MPAPKPGQLRIMMASISFLRDLESLAESDTVTQGKLFFHKDMRPELRWCYNASRWNLPMTERTQHLRQIEKILSSHALHGSESLCKLLRYLATLSLDHPGASPKEYQIATEVFGRQQDFDPHVDSMVRVQAGRLRTKLAEYYASEGAEDALLVELPKGTYALSFHPRTPNHTRNNEGLAIETSAASLAEGRSPQGWYAALMIFALILTAVAAVATDRLLVRRTNTAHAANEAVEAPLALRIFWKGFLTGPQEPWVIFSNAAFVGHPDTGMRYYNAARDAQTPTLDHYTGVGEVLGVHALDRVFVSLHQDLRLKRGSLFTLDDAKNNDLIFIGSPSENLTLLDIPGTKDFLFQMITSGISRGSVSIINSHPQPGEPKQFLRTPPDEPLTEDYSVIALKRGLDATHSVLILAGATTIGTQAAVEYVCQQNTLEELLLRLSVSNSGELKPFEAVIRVKVARGVPVGTELVALRKGPP
jgi:hypothetical protein